MVGETFWGLIGSAGIIASSVFVLILEMRKGRGDVTSLLDFIRNTTFSHVDERIALIYAMADEVKHWKNIGTDVRLKTSRIVSDITSIARIHNNMTFEQWRELQKALDVLIEEMKKRQYDTSEIEYTRKALR